ncbi:Mur ligase [Pyrenochaeta sp. MPI-SDFR-AT-0127]|nr:Mur ligase [Pyrenochaeta sp. MPI-SDFR-AT-0127]
MIQPGLERVGQLLKNVQFPWKAIHVAGTNGKGSICHYASSLLTRRLVKCGKFTSPHLVDRWDCISINEKPVNETLFRQIESHYMQLSQSEGINASPFEILTATAFHIFNEEKVQVGVVEVGMGGKLDATNILNNQAVSVISKIARDHQSFLGDTLEQIAQHKAGILRPNVPYVVNPVNEWNVNNVIEQYAKDIGAGPRLTGDTVELIETLYASPDWRRFSESLRPFQRDNVVLAIVAVKEIVASLGITLDNLEIGEMLVQLRKNVNPGRLQHLKVPPVFGKLDESEREIMVDGAHNPDAAIALNDFVLKNERQRTILGESPPKDGWPITWVLAMTEGKDAHQYLKLLLRPGDNVVTTSFGPVDGMPWVKSMDPKQLFAIAESVQPKITGLHMPTTGALRALCAARYVAGKTPPIVLTGSLYLVGDFHRELRSRSDHTWWTNPEQDEDRAMFEAIHEEERNRVDVALISQDL